MRTPMRINNDYGDDGAFDDDKDAYDDDDDDEDDGKP